MKVVFGDRYILEIFLGKFMWLMERVEVWEEGGFFLIFVSRGFRFISFFSMVIFFRVVQRVREMVCLRVVLVLVVFQFILRLFQGVYFFVLNCFIVKGLCLRRNLEIKFYIRVDGRIFIVVRENFGFLMRGEFDFKIFC